MSSLARRWIVIGALLGAIGVGLGAFGAHGLGDVLERLGFGGDDLRRRMAIFDTAIRYQLLHALALVLIGLMLAQRESGCWRAAAWAFLFGILLFCGLLKVLAFADPSWNWLGRIVPFGGASLIAGWVALAIGAWRART
jgi:uncharacterized membrane protein YgdD (TMEM256/DUF423 family)